MLRTEYLPSWSGPAKHPISVDPLAPAGLVIWSPVVPLVSLVALAAFCCFSAGEGLGAGVCEAVVCSCADVDKHRARDSSARYEARFMMILSYLKSIAEKFDAV